MKNKHLTGWRRDLAGMAFNFGLAMVGVMLDGVRGLSGLSLTLVLIGCFGLLVFEAILVIRGIRALIRRSTKNYEEPEIKVYKGISTGAVVDDKLCDAEVEKRRFIYNRKGELFRFNKEGSTITWPLCFVALVSLYPFGMYMIIAKTLQEKTRYYKNGVVLTVVGGLLALVNLAFILLICVTGADSFQALIGVCAGPAYIFLIGFSLFVYGLWLRHRGHENDDFIKLITQEQVTNMDEIAARQKMSYAKAADIVERLIDDGLLGGAYLYHPDREVVVPGISKKIVRVCPKCGATTTLYASHEMICDYCGGEL